MTKMLTVSDSIWLIKSNLKVFFAVIDNVFRFGWRRLETKEVNQAGNNIIIVGGELFNKGAQAMTFTVIDMMKRRFPSKKTYLLSEEDYKRKREDKEKYAFTILPWNLEIKTILLSPSLCVLFKMMGKRSDKADDIKKIIEDCALFIDVSGYALSSQWEWSRSFNYLLNIAIAKRFGVPYHIFPQSIGPFDYGFKDKISLYPLLRMYLKYPVKIFPREASGVMFLRRFTRKNVEKGYDIVLQGQVCRLDNIYREKQRFAQVRVRSDSVGVIPNARVMERVDKKEMFSIYHSLIDKLLQSRKSVYLIRHSYEDLEICRKIKAIYPNNERVVFIQDDLSAFELEDTIKKFDFIIASRYHSIIHAYRNGRPALSIGWASKYMELLKEFDQLEYFFDIRHGIETDKIIGALERLTSSFKLERLRIWNKMADMAHNNVLELFAA